MGMVPGLGTAMTFIGLALQGVHDRRDARLRRRIRVVRRVDAGDPREYKALAGAVLEGLIQAKSRRSTSRHIPLHPDVQAYLDGIPRTRCVAGRTSWSSSARNAGHRPQPGVAAASPLSRAQEIITPFYDPADPATALAARHDAFSLAREEWFSVLPNTTPSRTRRSACST